MKVQSILSWQHQNDSRSILLMMIDDSIRDSITQCMLCRVLLAARSIAGARLRIRSCTSTTSTL